MLTRLSKRVVALLSGILLSLFSAVGCQSDPIDELWSSQIYLGGEQLLIPAYGEIYTEAPFAKTLVLADTYYLLDGATTVGPMKGFENNGIGRITYTDITPGRVALLNITLTVSAAPPDVPATLHLRVFKNGVGIVSTTVQDVLTVGDRAESMPAVALVAQITTGDYVEVYLASDDADTDVTVATMHIVATTVD